MIISLLKTLASSSSPSGFNSYEMQFLLHLERPMSLGTIGQYATTHMPQTQYDDTGC